MVAVDTSVVVAAFGPWHEAHAQALAAMRDGVVLPSHCGIEVFSTLTRLPEPFRALGPVVADYLDRRFASRWIFPPEHEVMALAQQLTRRGIVGGASYDALVAITVLAHGCVLRTLDHRARPTYQAIGVEIELLA